MGADAVCSHVVVGVDAVGEVELSVCREFQVVSRVPEVDALGAGDEKASGDGSQAGHAELSAQEGPDAVQLFRVQQLDERFAHGGILHPRLQG